MPRGCDNFSWFSSCQLLEKLKSTFWIPVPHLPPFLFVPLISYWFVNIYVSVDESIERNGLHIYIITRYKSFSFCILTLVYSLFSSSQYVYEYDLTIGVYIVTSPRLDSRPAFWFISYEALNHLPYFGWIWINTCPPMLLSCLFCRVRTLKPGKLLPFPGELQNLMLSKSKCAWSLS